MRINPKIFCDYDIRAIIPDDLDMEGVRKIARALAYLYKPKNVAIGRDMRLSSDEIFTNLYKEFMHLGIDIIDLGLVTTDMVYFAAGKHLPDLAIMVSASHNPPKYNGFKIVKKGAIAVSGNSGIYDIRDLVGRDDWHVSSKGKGKKSSLDLYDDWIDYCLAHVKASSIKPFKVVIDAGNGMASEIIKRAQKQLPIKVIPLFFDLDGGFPNHVPNPVILENLQDLISAVKLNKADLGIAFDGDADRIAFVDEQGVPISGTVVTAMVAEMLLKKNKGATMLYNAVCGRVVLQTIKKLGGKPLRTRVGHTLIKEAMRKNNGLFCGEHSGHYFYKATYFAESALLTMLYFLELVSQKGGEVSQIVKAYDIYPQSGEINFEVVDKKKVMDKIANTYQKTAKTIDHLDGVSVWFDSYWFNVRPSNTEPLLRLNVEADTRKELNKKISILKKEIQNLGGKQVG